MNEDHISIEELVRQLAAKLTEKAGCWPPPKAAPAA